MTRGYSPQTVYSDLAPGKLSLALVRLLQVYHTERRPMFATRDRESERRAVRLQHNTLHHHQVQNKMQSETAADFASGAATWRTERNIRVVFDSDLFAALYKNKNVTSSIQPEIYNISHFRDPSV